MSSESMSGVDNVYYLQRSSGKYCCGQDLLFLWHFQFPERRHGKDQDYKVSDDVEDGGGQVGGTSVDTVPFDCQRIPNSFTWDTLNNSQDGTDRINRRAAPHKCVNGNVHGHVSFPVGNENSKVLKED